MRPADCSCARLRETEVQHLPFFDQILNRASYIFDWHCWIDPVLVEEVNAIGFKALKRGLSHLFDMLGPAIESYCTVNRKTKLACNNDFVAERRERFSDKLLVCIWAVNFGCIEERDAFFMGCTNDLNALVLGCGRPVVGANTHAPSSQFRGS